mmetsp:Transcript_28097/g.45660  ORF Transcript_28097/g.45660 Transcript_28097/m.45660 type:complete len:149 (+) Transcript_28097:1588-2034(+)
MMYTIHFDFCTCDIYPSYFDAQFKPEFLNRIDDTVIFNSLSKDNLRGIVALEITKLEKRLAEKDIRMIITPAALDTMADIGFDPVFGARPLKRAIQRELETSVAKGILRGDFTDGDEITIDSVDGAIAIHRSGVGTGYAQTGTETISY